MLTFEAIRNVERDERENKKLQKLPDNFFDTVRDYLRKKEEMKDKTSLDVMEIENTKNTIKRLLDIREKKVIELAVMSSRTGLAAENLTSEERHLFEQTVNGLKSFRDSIYTQMKKEPAETAYKVKKSMPDFIGPDMKNYSIRENDVITLPKELADLLIKENIVEKVE